MKMVRFHALMKSTMIGWCHQRMKIYALASSAVVLSIKMTKIFNLTSPCKDCPFRTDVRPYLRTGRVIEICETLIVKDQSFHCHKTTTHDDETGETVPTKYEMHCAGAMIMLEHMNRPNQMMLIGERLGSYDHTKLKMDAPVYTCTRAMVMAYKKENSKCRNQSK